MTATFIVRGVRDKDHPYFVAPRNAAQDKTLSWEARGVLWYLLSKSDDWILQPKDLEQLCSRDRVYRILDELVRAGYIQRKEKPDHDAKGKFSGWTYQVFESPCAEKPDTVEPHTDLPDTAQPDTEKPHITNKENKTDKDSAPQNGAEDKPQKQPKPAKPVPPPPFPRPRNPLFDAVAQYVFEITSPEQLKQMDAEEQASSRIGIIVSWLSGKKDRFKLGNSKKVVVTGFISSPAKPEHVKRFMADYKLSGKTELRDIEKFVERWRAWASKLQRDIPAVAYAPPLPPAQTLTPDEIAARQREKEAILHAS